MKKIFLLLLSFLLLFSCSIGNTTTKNKAVSQKSPGANKINVVTSIVPLVSITNYIGQDEVYVTNIVPVGTSPHSFDMKLNQMPIVRRSDLIISIGLDHIDGFLKRMIKDENVIYLSKGITLLEGTEDEEEMNTTRKENNESEKDPHIWLGIENVKIIASSIKDELSSIKPEKKEYFEQNYNNFISQIDTIVNDFNTKTNGKSQSRFIVLHDAYNYLFTDLRIDNKNKFIYNKNIVTDIDPKRLSNLQLRVSKEQVKFIFKEPQIKDGDIKKFANMNKLTILNLDPLGTDTGKDGYINNLKNNLSNLINIYE